MFVITGLNQIFNFTVYALLISFRVPYNRVLAGNYINCQLILQFSMIQYIIFFYLQKFSFQRELNGNFFHYL